MLCQHTVGRDVETVDGTGNYAAIKPGDTVCVQAGKRGELKIRNVRGEPGKPVTFINHGGVVTITNGGYAGIHIRNSEHVRVVGTGVSDQCGAFIAPADQQCGFKIYGKNGRGVTANEKTRYVEISHVEVAGSGQSAITSQTSDVPREQFTQFDTKIHHTYVHDVPNDEGIYLGSSYYPSGDDPVLKGVDVSYNLVVNTGRDGIQVGSAVENCEIHHNRIERSSQRAESDHDGGIINNKGSVCNIYNNTIVDAGENGIKLYGSGGNKVYNNLIVRPGRKASGAKGSGIVMANSNATTLSMYVWNNTIVGANGNGIQFAADYGDHHQILNNLIVGAAGKAIDGVNGKVTVSHNLTLDDPKFTDPDRGDYSLRVGSPAIDVGVDLTGLGITIDNRDRKRPQGRAFDVGAFEQTAGESS